MNEPSYRKLIAWQKAHRNAILIIEILDKINFKYSKIVIQCITSATSIGANIAEGNAARTIGRKKSYFEIALNSSYEFDNWLQILKDTKNICKDQKTLLETEQQNIEVIKILTKLLQNLES